MQALIEQMLLIELGQIRQQFFRIAVVMMHIAIDELDALFVFAGPAGRCDGRCAFLADMDLVEFVDCLHGFLR